MFRICIIHEAKPKAKPKAGRPGVLKTTGSTGGTGECPQWLIKRGRPGVLKSLKEGAITEKEADELLEDLQNAVLSGQIAGHIDTRNEGRSHMRCMAPRAPPVFRTPACARAACDGTRHAGAGS